MNEPVIRERSWLLLSLIVVVLDQWTKHLAMNGLTLHEPVPILPYLNFTLTTNPGAAFSFLRDAGGWQRWLFISISSVVSIAIFVWLFRLRGRQRLLACALALVLGGAIANLWDRVTLGEVVDFVDVYFRRWHWPAFNVADSAISIGAILLLYSAFKTQPAEP